MFRLIEMFTLPEGKDLEQIHFIPDAVQPKLRIFLEVRQPDKSTIIFEAVEETPVA